MAKTKVYGYRTGILTVFPWDGGVKTSVDPALLQPSQLAVGENVLFDTQTTRKHRPGINYNWDNASNGSDFIIAYRDFWFGTNSRTQVEVGVSSAKNFYKYTTAGVRTAITVDAGATAWASAIGDVSLEVINSLLIFASSGSGNVLRKWAGGSNNIFDLGGTPPQASVLRTHLGRLWANDKTNKDRLHYSTTANPEQWQGTGDSGALDIGVGDGDPVGITAIFPTFKGELFVAKSTKLYRISGYTPETFMIELISDGIGCTSHNSIAAIDQEDMFFLSDKGIHSLVATVNYGDFSSTYVSADIQKDINQFWVKSRFESFQAAYLPNINSYAIAVTDNEISTTANNTIWFYNIPQKAWYSWPNVDCQALAVIQDADQRRFYLGTSVTRIAKTLTTDTFDTATDGSTLPIIFRVQTGRIFVTQNPYTRIAFKKVGLLFNPVGNSTLVIRFKIDTYDEQVATIVNTSSADLLGVDFILDQSVLGEETVLEPTIFSVDGYGRSFQMTIEQTGANDAIELLGFHVEYEVMGPQQENSRGV